MRIFIEPTEPLLFRDGRPFIAGENNFANTLFPPTPETLQGALRATIAMYRNPTQNIAEIFKQKDVIDLIGTSQDYGRFCITGISLGRHATDNLPGDSIERLFPGPVHVIEDEEDGQQARLLPRENEATVHTNLPKEMQLLYPDKPLTHKAGPIKGWLTERGLQRALWTQGAIPKAEIVRTSDIYTYESRMGIGMSNATKATKDGLLYQMRMIRMNHKPDYLCQEPDDTHQESNRSFLYGFVVDIRLAQSADPANTLSRQFIDDQQTQEILKLPDSGWLLLGGERRAARFEVIKPGIAASHEEMEQRAKGNLLYLATPAAFDRGWQPTQWVNPPVKPISVAIDRYHPIGGWQLKAGSNGGANKAMRRCVPAGSVYFFDQSVSLSAPFTNYGSQIGYGIAYLGEISK